jgi:flavin-dependent dehydrogenase
MIRARWVIGADGLHSRVRRWAGLEGSAPCRQRFGRRRHYQIPPWTDHVEVYWTDAMEAYVTPISAREVGVAILGPAEPHSFNALLLRFPTLLERLKEAPAVSTVRGAGPLRQSARAVGHDNVLLIGDAAGYVDAITGEGIAVAFAQAEALAASLETQSRESELRDRAAVLRRYVRAHARIVRRPDRMTRMVLLLSERRRLRRLVLATLGRWPNLFDRALAFMAASNRSGC